MAHDDDDHNGSGQAGTVLKTVLMTLGALVAFVLVLGVVKSVLFYGLLAGAGYLGYRAIAGGGGNRKQVTGGRSQRALGSGRSRSSGNSSDDFDRKMRELDAIEKRLDAEIGKR